LWLGVKQGVIGFKKTTQVWKTYYSPEVLSIPSIIYEDKGGKIWFVNSEGYISIYDSKNISWVTHHFSDLVPVKNKLTPPETIPFQVNGMVQDQSGQILIATIQGLILFNESKNTWQLLTPENSALPDSNITCIYKDESSRIWIGTSKGIIVLEP
jgi:ligand-binding sensor domain-containing protein